MNNAFQNTPSPAAGRFAAEALSPQGGIFHPHFGKKAALLTHPSVGFVVPERGWHGMAELDLETRSGGDGISHLILQGDFDADSAPRVQQALETLCDREQPTVYVNIADLNYIDSAGLGVLVGALKQASARGGQIVLVQPSPFVSRILRVTALDKVFTVQADTAPPDAASR